MHVDPVLFKRTWHSGEKNWINSHHFCLYPLTTSTEIYFVHKARLYQFHYLERPKKNIMQTQAIPNQKLVSHQYFLKNPMRHEVFFLFKPFFGCEKSIARSRLNQNIFYKILLEYILMIIKKVPPCSLVSGTLCFNFAK